MHPGQSVIIKSWDAFQSASLVHAVNEVAALFSVQSLGVAPKVVAFGWAEGGTMLSLVMDRVDGHPFQAQQRSKCGRSSPYLTTEMSCLRS